MSPLVIYGLGFITVTIFVLGVASMFSGRENALERLDNLAETNVPMGGESILKDDVDRRFEKILKPFRERLANEDVEKSSKRANFMIQAGYYNRGAFSVLYLTRFILAAVLTGIVALGFIFLNQNFQPMTIMGTIFAVALFGYFLPFLYVKSRISDRQQKFRDGLPDAMDMLLVSLEAGLSFPASLKHVANEMREVHPIISEHFELVTLEFQAGRQRAEALKNLSSRVDIDEIHGLTTMIIQSEELGTSLTAALRASAEDMRRDRMLVAEEKANKLPVKMSLPLVGCIFPTLFAIILVPVVVTIVRTL